MSSSAALRRAAGSLNMTVSVVKAFNHLKPEHLGGDPAGDGGRLAQFLGRPLPGQNLSKLS